MIDEIWPPVLAAGIDVILDFGLWTRVDRDEVRRLASNVGAEVRLYHVRCSEEEARRRCRERNRVLGTSFHIDDAAYDALRARFESLGPDEPFESIDTDGPGRVSSR